MGDDAQRRRRIEDFAAAMRGVKNSTSNSFETLAERLHISRSTLHRYCAGRAVPPEFSLVREFAQQCGARESTVAELHRLWALASEPVLDRAVGSHTTSATEPAVPERRTGTTGVADADATGVVVGAGPPRELVEPTRSPERPGSPTSPEPVGPPVSSEPVEPEELEESADPAASPERAGRRRSWTIASVLGMSMVLTALLLAAFWAGGEDERAPASQAPPDRRVLFNEPCLEPVALGQHDECVRELQELLLDAGTVLDPDGIFGPETQRRVEAFQVLAGLDDIDGVAGDRTKEALYAGTTDMTTWNDERVAERVREVFQEKPDIAVRIARCQSFLDPLHILPNADNTRNWGVFQISDMRLRDLDGTPEEALDPDWNIKAAYELWSEHEDFSHWPHCAAAAEPEDADPEESAETAESGDFDAD